MLKAKNNWRISKKTTAITMATVCFLTAYGVAGKVDASDVNSVLDITDMFSERDMEQEADLTDAKVITVTDGEDIHITEEGVYVINGSAVDATIYVEVDDAAKVQIVLDGAAITNTDKPVIYGVEADKIFVTTLSDSTLTVTGAFAADSENTGAVIFSETDLVFNGTAALTISSTDGAVDTKDDLKITGGTYEISSAGNAFEANDSVRIADGTFTINTGKDAFHAENHEDDSKGYIYIADGTFHITAEDDGIQGNAIVRIDGGAFTINAAEAIEGTYVQINDGTIDITASDDGINAAAKSASYEVKLEINGGDLTIDMGQGDTDALDANGNLEINGGSLNITAASAFDYDGSGMLNGGTVIVNGQEVTELTPSMMGGGFGGGHGGRGGFNNLDSMPRGDMPKGDMAPPDMDGMPEDHQNFDIAQTENSES
ncbi:MAG: carbohydrate-binding domain-containing protein [Eubacteriales bacterium]|nr:carbohydrate-binding domain-containing protein [Eubacteriales bacterium]